MGEKVCFVRVIFHFHHSFFDFDIMFKDRNIVNQYLYCKLEGREEKIETLVEQSGENLHG